MFQEPTQVLGIMSGSSLDGIDIGCFEFQANNFKILKTKTYPIGKSLFQKLKTSDKLSEQKLKILDETFGRFIGEMVSRFLKNTKLIPKFIGLHGHTVFHEPGKGFSLQIGAPKIVASITGLTTVADFRNIDISLGGQGAPLVPFGDINLFPGYDAYINLGGIANITLPSKNLAFDITYANRALNFIANKLGLSYDNKGKLAREGSLIAELFETLQKDKYLKINPPKSLNNQDFDQTILPVISNYLDEPMNVLHTYNHFLAENISRWITPKSKVLITGGGAKNKFLVELIEETSKSEIITPKKEIIDFKEALIFAFLALKKIKGELNVLSKFTGASNDSVSGMIFYPQ